MQQTVDYVTPAEAARRLCVSVELVRAWLRSGRMAYVRTPLGRLIPATEVERLAAERRRKEVDVMRQ